MEIRIDSGIAPEFIEKHRKYNQSAKGKARRNSYDRSVNDRRYLDREFVAWDGEGGNEEDGSHTYFLISCSAGFSRTNRAGLGTDELFRMFINAQQTFDALNKTVTHVGYGLNYDVNMIIKDIDQDALSDLYKTGRCKWRGFFVEWRPGKSFAVRLGETRFLLYDVLPFFQRSFIAACDEYLGPDSPLWSRMREQVVREKARRGSFDWSELESIVSYNDSELALLVALTNELRTRLYRVGIKVTRWDGPGAIAGALYKKYETKSHKGESPSEVARAARFAYAGGRFEIVRKGHSVEGAFQYDLRSAYPSAARYLPCLAHGKWVHRKLINGIIRTVKPFGVYRIEVVNPPTASQTQPQPLWMRNKDGTVYFSEFSHGWYWSPEARLMTELGGVNIHEGWEWEQECDHQPFHFVEPLYLKRAALKKAGDGAHVGLKLGLNSLYGKLAQQIGWGYDKDGNLRLPPFHCLEWAGWITSHCRSEVYRASVSNLSDIIAYETDAVFSRVPLDLDIGDGLGQWDPTVYTSLTYLKSGMYFGTLDDGTEIEKSRGINKGTITRQQVIDALEAEQRGPHVPTLPATQTRFISLGQAMNQGMHKWRRWETSPRNIKVSLNGKRIDLYDKRDMYMHLNDGWTETVEGYSPTEFSYEYPVAWINPNPDMASPDGLEFDEKRLTDMHEIYD